MAKLPVIHHNDGREARGEDVFGFAQRKGIFATALLTISFAALSTTGEPWWITLLPASEIDIRHLIIGTIFLIGALLTLALWYLRKRTIRSLQVKYLLHQIAHKSRDIQTNLSKDPNNVGLKSATKEFSTIVQDFFRELIPDKDIQVAIRIARDIQSKPKYATITRTSGLNPNREKYTKPMPADKGLARFFQHKSDGKGVLIYNNIIKAADMDAYELSETDRMYPAEIITMMVAGMNAWDSQKDSMIGIIYITSRNKNVFKIKHVDLLGFIADLGAFLVASIINEK